MALSYEANKSNSIKNSSNLNNVFVDNAKIIDLDTVKTKTDVGVKVTMQIEGKEWKKFLYLHGRFERDDNNRVVGFGSAKKIARFLSSAGVDEELINKLDVDGILPCFPKALNKTITIITYKDRNDKYYNVYPLVESANSHEKLEDTFKGIWDKTSKTDKPYPNDFIGFNKEFKDSHEEGSNNGPPLADNEKVSARPF